MDVLDFVYELIRYEVVNHPVRSFIDVVLIVLFVYMLFQKSYRIPKHPEKLTEEEMDMLIEEWVPEPLVPEEKDAVDRFGKRLFTVDYRQPRVVKNAPGRRIEIEGVDHKILNFATFNFLGLAADKDTIEACKEAVVKYGVGSCGPRGFYGTIDVHMEAERRIAEFMDVDDCIIYSFGFCTVSSVIPAFSKRGDLLVCDERIGFAIQEGVSLSRSKATFFKHNDMEDLERILREVTEKDKKKGGNKDQRRYIVVQGVYENCGDVAPLHELIKLKEKYNFRLIVDDSFGVGAIGETGRGSIEHCNVSIKDIDIFTANLENAFGTVGGFCIGSRQAIDYQRLGGLGYVFSASLPPYISVAMIEALNRLRDRPKLLKKLAENVRTMNGSLIDALQQHCPQGYVLYRSNKDSPIFHLTLSPSVTEKFTTRKEQEDLLEDICERAIQFGVAVSVPRYSEREKSKPEPSLRVVVSSEHTAEDIESGARMLIKAVSEVVSKKLQESNGTTAVAQ